MARRGKSEFASVRRLGSGRYQVRITGPDGVRRPAPRTFPTKLAADAYADAKRREINRDGRLSDDEPQPVPFEDYAQQWLADRQVAGRPIKARTRRHYQGILDRELAPVFGSVRLTAITPAMIRAWYTGTLVDNPTMRAHTYSLLKSILATAVADEIIDSQPCRIRGAGAAKRVRTIRPASADEIEAITAKMPGRLQLAVTCASWCAMRLGETLELRRRDVDLDAGIIRIRRAVVRVGGKFEPTTPKSTAGTRDVAIPPHLIDRFRDHLVTHTGPGADALLFPSSVDPTRYLQSKALYVDFHRARAEIVRDDLRWHDLRHSGAVLAAATGASLAELMARLGHSTPGAAMRYQHSAEGRDREIAALLSKLADTTALR
jgi:integrase